jgi:integron cassette Hfx-like protein
MSTLIEDEIVEVGIDQGGKLYVRPRNETFEALPYVWRAGMEVNWDPVRRVLYGSKPRAPEHLGLSYAGWFRQILTAAEGECGVRLRLTPQTTWSGIPDALRSEIERMQVDLREPPSR